MTSSTSTTDRPATSTRTSAYAVFSSLVVLLQGLWAGIFLEHDGERDAASGWIDLHARGADLAILLAVLATVWAVWKLRSRTDLWVGSLVLAVLLVLESYLGGAIRDAGKDTLTAVHVPLAMLVMGLAVWLPVRARSGRR